ncbi:alpha/beta hydrolase [Limosilactobacillus fermentum]
MTWLRDNATRFGVNPNQLVVGGDSAAVCLRARDQGDVKIAW